MQASQLPAKLPIPFANAAGAGFIRSIPTASQIGISNGAASLADGFPPLCFQPVGSGGIPPAGQDFNGILYAITAWARWQAAGGTVPFDQTFANAIGGYPYGAIVQSTTSGKLWLCTADNNATNPDGGSAANWTSVGVGSGINLQIITASGTYTPTATAKKALVIATAGGGAGGAAGTIIGLGDGGESGATAIALVGLVGVSSVPCTIGAGGIPTSAPGTSGTRGGSGGTTIFGPYINVPGGMGALNQSGNGSSAGGTTGGSLSGCLGIVMPGNPGTKAFNGTQSGSGGASFGTGGNGGPSFWGGAGLGVDGNSPSGTSAATQGGPATGYGSGGGGADNGVGTSSGTYVSGGAGGAGVIFILEFA